MFLVYHALEDLPSGFAPSALTIGNFDGVHLGHDRILRSVVEIARARQWQAVALTFHPHPTRIVAPDRVPQLLTSPSARLALLEQAGLDAALVLPFTRETAGLSPEEFVSRIVAERLAARAIVVGANFRFGRGQAGDVAALEGFGRRFNFAVRVVEPVRCRGELVSSSRVRQLISEGRVSRVARMLQRPFAVEGRVVAGRGVGSRQTVPTLNLAPETEVLPARGVYSTCTLDPATGRRWPSVTNIGYRPTFDGKELTVETFLLSPLEGETPSRISVAFWRRLREEIRFASPELLRAQILRDAGATEKFFRLLKAARKTDLAKEVLP